jgi:pimeloyl-ACP methyl ester carboxylesterase
MGRSMGANPALEIAANHAERFNGLIIESGAGNLRRLALRAGLDPEDEHVRTLLDGHEDKIRGIGVPVLIIHGQNDELIPLPFAAELFNLLPPGSTELVVIPNAGHNDILWLGYREYFAAIETFIDHAP